MTRLLLDPAATALVMIDLQHGIVGMDLSPRTGPMVAAAALDLAHRFRAGGACVVAVHVGWSADGADRPSAAVDRPLPPVSALPADWSRLVPGVAETADVVVLKRQWGAFTGTDLDLQLRRRGVRTIVLAGIATNFGVESTARAAWELGYDVVVVEDACTSRSEALHAFSIKNVLPQIARVVQTEAVAFAAG